MARPAKPIDLKLLEDLARIQCTDEEMASILGFTREGFRKRKQRQLELVGIIEKGKEAGQCSLRRLQWKSATGGNIAMQIWLGKQYLRQREPRQEVELSDPEHLKRIAELEEMLLGSWEASPNAAPIEGRRTPIDLRRVAGESA
jgi:hypothetical protein